MALAPNTPRPPHGAAVLAELERVAASPAFGGSARQIRLLRFLVGEALAGRGDALNAALVATRVFGRPASFDPAEDTIVRVEMSKLRRAIDRHYGASPVATVRIDLPRGHYAPDFVACGDVSPRPPLRPAGAASPTLGESGPVVAVLPFTAPSSGPPSSSPGVAAGGDPPPESSAAGARSWAFASGLTDRLGGLFGATPCVTIVSHASTLDEAAARGARYVLEGSVRSVPGALRVTAKLHDTTRWVQVWAQTFDRAVAADNLFTIEDEIAHAITTQLLLLPLGAVHVIEAEERSGLTPRSSYELVLALPRWLATFEPRLQAELEVACSRVLAVGDAAHLGVMLAASSIFHLLGTWTARGSAEGRRRSAEHARRAVLLDPRLPAAHQALAFALLDAGDPHGALAEAELALTLGGPLMLTGLVVALAGEWERGTAVVQAHLAVSRHAPSAIRHVYALAAYRRGDYAAALAEATAIATPNLAWDPLDRAVALARLGRLPEARAAAAALTAILPEVARDPRGVIARVTADRALREDLVEALRLAGVG